jgi:hypothetical protein
MREMSRVNVVAIRKPMGRPSIYTPDVAEKFLARLSGGMSVERICRHKDMPSKSHIYRWIGERADFRDNYLRAMAARGMKHGDDVLAVVEKVIAGEIAPDVGRVAIQGLTWAAARMAPKVYGDRVALTGADGGEIGVRVSDARTTIEGKLARLALAG